jgi:hypothetical protein
MFEKRKVGGHFNQATFCVAESNEMMNCWLCMGQSDFEQHEKALCVSRAFGLRKT